MFGSCFCESIKFEVAVSSPAIYQCHCSMCRKVTSSTSNTAFITAKENFKWICGSENITAYCKPAGYRVNFCNSCGSTVPNDYQEQYVWVPVGLLEGEHDFKIANHLCVASKASWDMIADSGQQYSAVPELAQIISV